MIYLDNSATTRPRPQVTAAMAHAMEEGFGNPSSLHSLGVEAERRMKKARQAVAAPLGVSPERLFFTSGGTESNNLAILGAYGALRKRGKLVSTKIEHKSVSGPLAALGGAYLAGVDEKGVADLDELAAAIDGETSLVSVMHVNNETGAIQPIEEIARIIRRKNPACLFHVDAVQSYHKLPFPKDTADLVTISAHKIHGPKGVGALYVRKGVRIAPLVHGGGQEAGLRGGTENTPGIAGFAAAAALPEDLPHVRRLYERLRGALTGIHINSHTDMPYILNVSAEGLRSEVLLHSLEQQGVIVSAGSACSARKHKPSHVLTAMGLSPLLAGSSIRISLSSFNTEDEVREAAAIINRVVADLREQMGIRR